MHSFFGTAIIGSLATVAVMLALALALLEPTSAWSLCKLKLADACKLNCYGRTSDFKLSRLKNDIQSYSEPSISTHLWQSRKATRPFTRFIATVALTVMPIGGLIPHAEAQIPTMDEYYKGNGAIVRPAKPADAATVFPVRQVFKKELPSYFDLEAFAATLQDINSMSSKQLWDDILKELKILDSVNRDFYGFGSSDKLATALHTTSEKAKNVEGLRADLMFAMGQLEEYCLQHRVIFFNVDDLNQINLLREETPNTNVIEDLSYREHIQAMQELLRSIRSVVAAE